MKSYLYILLILVLCGCTNELYDNPKEEELSKNGIPVKFSISNTIFSKSENKTLISDAITLSGSDTISSQLNNFQTKSISPIPVGSTIRVIAYKRKSSGAAPNTANDIFISSQSYQITASNILTPVNVDSDGNIESGSAPEMYLTSGEYDFYAYSPAIPMLNDSTVAINQGTDFIATHLESTIVNAVSNTINLPNFERKMAQIELIIQPDPSATQIYSLELGDPGIALILPGAATSNIQIGNEYNASGAGSFYLLPEDSCKEVASKKLVCTCCVFPQKRENIALELYLEINDEDHFYNAFIDSATFEPGNKYIYQINIKPSNINILPIANCYMAQPNKPIMFPINQINAMGTFNSKLQTWEASVYWQTSPDLIDIKMQDQKNDIIQIETSGEGNGLVVITPKNSNTILWSWHIWSTNYVPNEGLSAPMTSSVPGGRVIRLNSAPFTNKLIVMMDRNIGAMSASHDASSWGMYYQWGRKDPFPPATMKIYGASINYSLAYLSSYYSAIKNPVTFYYGYLNWLLNGSNYLWSSSEKSIFDPCPPGWRVAKSSTYNVPMASTINWINATGAYNDGAVYTPHNVWYPAQGAIDFLTGYTKWQGQYAYIWSSTYGFFDDSYALAISRYFNTSADDESRAYGMPVRCIQN